MGRFNQEVQVPMMTKCFFIHGTPSSAESTAKNIFDGFEDRISGEYFNGVRPTSRTCLICETRGWKGGLFTVYTYYVSCSDNAGRNGPTYCALTLIVQDGITAHIGTLYETLKKAFVALQAKYHYIDESNQFIINTFRDKPGLSELSGLVLQEVEKMPFEDLVHDYQKSGEATQPLCFNIADILSGTVVDGLKKQGKICVAPDYPTLEQIASMKKVQEEAKKMAHKGVNRPSTQVGQEDSGTPQPSYEDTQYMNLKLENKALRSENESLRERLAEQSYGNNDNEYSDGTGASLFRAIRPIEWLIVANFVLLMVCLSSIFFYANKLNVNSIQSVEAIELLKERSDSLLKTCESIQRKLELLERKSNTPAKKDTVKKSVANGSKAISL